MIRFSDNLRGAAALGNIEHQSRHERSPGRPVEIVEFRIAVDAVRGMEKSCRGPRRCESCSDLASDQSGLACPGNYNAAFGACDALNGSRKVIADATLRLA